MSTPHEKALEAAAHAWADEEGCGDFKHRENTCFKTDECVCLNETKRVARAYLTSLSEQGWKMVPVEPTEEMLAATSTTGTARCPTLADYYQAMINAAPKVTE